MAIDIGGCSDGVDLAVSEEKISRLHTLPVCNGGRRDERGHGDDEAGHTFLRRIFFGGVRTSIAIAPCSAKNPVLTSSPIRL